jgi:threonylcarbamoyladenosine tRNA methylthiotransferase MtaB
MKSVALHNLGCKVNSYEFDVMQQMLQENGFQIVSFDERADVYVVNTCTVTNMADRKSRQMLHKAKKMNPQAVVVATGCYVQTGQEDLIEDLSVDLIIGNNKKAELADILLEYLKNNFDQQPLHARKTLDETTVIDINRTDEFEEVQLYKTAEHTRAYIKIQDGCNQFCSYCIIPYARGRVRSRKKEDVLSEIKGLVSRGYQEVVLTGIHLSSYGVDFLAKTEGDYLAQKAVGASKKTLAFERGFLIDLIEAIQELEGLHRIRLGSLEPRIITEDFVTRLAACSKVCPHFHLSLQSGSDDTLKRMNRYYTASEFKEKVALLRTKYPKGAITTDIIVGFPGESQEEFLETKKYLEEIRFFEMHVFKFSKRKNTPAATMKLQVSDSVKQLRSDILLEMAQEYSKEFRKAFIGREVEVLMEEEKIIDEVTYQIGHTPEYIKVAFPSSEKITNQIVRGIVTDFLDADFMLMN